MREVWIGAHGAEEIPVPIPNTEVKLSSGDYTATSGKLARCRIIKSLSEQERLFLLEKPPERLFIIRFCTNSYLLRYKPERRKSQRSE